MSGGRGAPKTGLSFNAEALGIGRGKVKKFNVSIKKEGKLDYLRNILGCIADYCPCPTACVPCDDCKG